MWRPARRLLLLINTRSEVCASRLKATPVTPTLFPGVSCGGVRLLGCGSLTPHHTTTATPQRLLHTSPRTTAEVGSSAALVEAEPDHLYSCVEVECRGHEVAVLRSYQKFVTTAAAHLDIPLEEINWPKKHIQRWTLLKSVHIHKKHRVQYEARTHFLLMRFARMTGSTADTFLEYVQRNLPEGVAMKVTTHQIERLPPHVESSAEVVT